MKLSRSDIIFACVATLAMGIGYFTSDIYLPALPILRDYFHITVHHAQQTLSAYFFGFALAQLIAGPIAEHYGFRKLALIACSGLTLMSLACAAANSIEFLIIGRFMQALFAGALGIIARASFAKYYSEEKATHVYMLIAPAVSLSPAIAPVIGGYLVHHFQWRSTFIFLSLFSFVLLTSLLIIFKFDEKRKADSSIHPRYILKTYKQLLSKKIFLGKLLLLAGTFASYFAYIAEAPFIFHQFNFTAEEIGLSFVPVALSFFTISQITRKLMARNIKQEKVIHFGIFTQIIGFLLLIPIYYTTPTPLLIIAVMSLMSGGCAFITPILFTTSMMLFKENLGYVAGLISAIPFIFSSLSAFSVHAICGDNLFYLALFCSSIIIVGGLCFKMIKN